MGDLAADTTVEHIGTDDSTRRYRATLSPAWEIWGPMGGYVAAVALRAAGASSTYPRPASIACHYLGVAGFGPLDLSVTPLREGRAAASYRVEAAQDRRRILEATVWATRPDDVRLEHDDAVPPDVDGPDGLLSIEQLTDDPPWFPFWSNLESRPVEWSPEWPPTEPVPPVWRQWQRFRPTATFADPWIDACRSVVLVDVQSWPAAHRPHAYRELPIYGPSLDLYVAFHRSLPEKEWLLCDGHSPVGADSLLGWTGRLWSDDRQLVASGGGQALCRPVRGG